MFCNMQAVSITYNNSINIHVPSDAKVYGFGPKYNAV